MAFLALSLVAFLPLSQACNLPEPCTEGLAGVLVYLSRHSRLSCAEQWSQAVHDSAGDDSIHHYCPSWAGAGRKAWDNAIYKQCWSVIRSAALQMSVQICLPGFDKEVYEAALRQDRADLPVCGKMPVVPVWGNVVATKGTVNDGPARKEVEAWDFQLQETKCRLGVREAPQILSCLEGSWLVLLGASQSSVWLQQLANTLAPNAFNALRDHFITDGVWLQLMDLVIEDGQVVHKQIVYNGDMTQLNNHGGAHSAELDAVALPGVYANLALAPPFNGRQIRITNLLAEYWDEADLGLLALEGSTEGGWDRAQIFPVVAVGLWYGYSVGCTLGWCSTRPEIAGLDTEAMVEVYLQGMRRTADMLQDFCGPNGRASKHGCTVMSVEYCSEYYKNPVYNHLHQAIRKHFQEYTSSQVRYFDVYSLTEQVPEDCIYGHMSPASAAFVLQLLLSSVCPTDQVAEGSLVTFKGKACRSEQIQPMCPGMSCGNFTYTWDYALSKNCQLLAAKDENQKSPLPQGGATADAWMLQVDDMALTTTTTTTTLFEANVSNSTESNISNATTTRQAVVVVADVQPDEEKEYKIFGTTTAPKGAQGFETSVMKDNVFLAWYNMLSAQKDPYVCEWILVLLYLLTVLLIVRHAAWFFQALRLDDLLDWLFPSLKVKDSLGAASPPWAAEQWIADIEKFSELAPCIPSDPSPTRSQLSLSLDQLEAGNEVMSTSDEASDRMLLGQRPRTCEDMVVPAASAASTRFSFGLARYAASLHVVLGHLHARNLSGGAYICCWGYTWVPWFFMLSGFILCAAEIKNPRQESFVDYVARRLVTIYPVYAFGLLVACCLANLNAPSAWVLVLQAWLLQAWLPLITEWGLQMQCWFLSCLVVYWALFPWLFRTVSKLTLHQVLFAMLMAIMVPVLYLAVPDLFYGNATWYEYHEWGHMRNSTDALVVMLKFHPVCYFHVFLFGMFLARFRVILSEFEFKNQPEYQKVLGVVMELLAPLGYAGLMLVFNVPVASPPFAKLSARIFALLPLQAAVVMGLAGLEGQAQPRLARCFSPFNFLESYSYCLYVMQFICMKVWIGKDFGLAFFVFLIASAALVQILVQKPAETLWKVSPTKASWRIPAALCVVVLGIWMFTRWQASEVALPELVQRDGYLDRRLPLRVEGDDEGAIINPSITLLGDELVLAARLHRRSSRLTHDQRGAVLEEIWHSKILLGSLTLSAESWQRFHGGGHIPGDSIYLRPWEGLFMMNDQKWRYPNLCWREKWLPENQTTLRFVVTGPEDPKIFPMARSGCASASNDCYSLRKGDACSSRQQCETSCRSKWCSSPEVQVAFSSYTPKENGMNCSGRDVVQMFLSSGVNVRHPDRVNHGLHLRCGQMDHNEKNWIPFQKEGRSFIVYSLVPHLVRELVYDGNGTCGKEWRTVFPKLEDIQENRLDVALRGSAQAVYVDEPDITANLMKPHFLGLFHVADLKVRRYAHYAYRFSPEPPFAILQVSKPLPLLGLPPEVGSAPFAFASGLAVHGDKVILTYAAGDREPRAMLMSLGRLDAFFQ